MTRLWRSAAWSVALGIAASVAVVVAGEGQRPAVAAAVPGRPLVWRQLVLPLEGLEPACPARLVVAAARDLVAVAALPVAGAAPGRLWVVKPDLGGVAPRARAYAVPLEGTGVEVGAGLAVDGRTLVVGADEAEDGAGVVWLVRDTSPAGDWSSVAAVRVQPPRPSPGAHFGRSVAMSGRVIAVGAPLDGSMWHGVGSLWVVRDRSQAGNWSSPEVGSVWPGGVNLDDRLGAAVAVDGRTLVVGMPLKDIFAPLGGAAFVVRDTDQVPGFRRWHTVRLRPTGVGFYEGLGRAVAVSGRTAVVGGRGAVWVFRDTSSAGDWGEVVETLVRPAGVGPSFGSAVAASGGSILVGEPDANRSGTQSGAVWLVELPAAEGAPLVTEIPLTGRGRFSRLGHSLAMAGDIAVVAGWVGSPSAGSPAGWPRLLVPAVHVADFESGTTASWGATTEPPPTPTPKPRRRRR